MDNPFFSNPSQLIQYLKTLKPDKEGFYTLTRIGQDVYKFKPSGKGQIVVEGGNNSTRKQIYNYLIGIYNNLESLRQQGKLSEADQSYLLHNWFGYHDSMEYRRDRMSEQQRSQNDSNNIAGWRRVRQVRQKLDQEEKIKANQEAQRQRQRSRQRYTSTSGFQYSQPPQAGRGSNQDRYIYDSATGKYYVPGKNDNIGEVNWGARTDHPSMPRGVPNVDRNSGLWVYDASTGFYTEYNPQQSTARQSRRSSRRRLVPRTQQQRTQQRAQQSTRVQQSQIQQSQAQQSQVTRPDSGIQIDRTVQPPIIPTIQPSISIQPSYKQPTFNRGRYTYGLGSENEYKKVYTDTPITGYTYDDEGNIYYNGKLQSYKIGGRLISKNVIKRFKNR